MKTVALYSMQPILSAGLREVIAGLEDFTLTGEFDDIELLMEHVRTQMPSVVLLEVTSAITFGTLSNLKPMAGSTPIVLWVDAISPEFVSHALALGVRGILRKSLPIELQVKCLSNVVAGSLWVEQDLCDWLLTAKRVALTRRERQLISLLAQGLKNKEIAYAMTLSEGTIKVYLSRLFQKVGANDRFELALYALKNFFPDVACAPEPGRTGEDRLSAPPVLPLPLPSFFSMERIAAHPG
jgi:DNA-binding NarL/FixJ family response regulator